MRILSVLRSAFAVSVAAATKAAYAAAVSQNDLLVTNGTSSANANTDVTFRGGFLTSAQNLLFSIMAVVSVGVFVVLGYRLVTAHGNPEEFKKAWVSVAYAAVGLALIPAAYAAVKIVSGLNVS